MELRIKLKSFQFKTDDKCLCLCGGKKSKQNVPLFSSLGRQYGGGHSGATWSSVLRALTEGALAHMGDGRVTEYSVTGLPVTLERRRENQTFQDQGGGSGP